ncbi:hypothetical protein BsIDN1_29740 [Bacillus safensis]|uniref:Flagellar basal body rod protein N-terminal domain-containing protein n=1 Tax=Bacillus safensis TaxID=561879 RepID=A0A5S9MCW1_BACIA|nr:hypothetical protein BsIDN1_29740 [Bacillus safensis]
MLRSLYSGISGMKNFQSKLDVVANNVANVNTHGYKKRAVSRLKIWSAKPLEVQVDQRTTLVQSTQNKLV